MRVRIWNFTDQMICQEGARFPQHLSAVWQLILQQLISPVFRQRDYTTAISDRGGLTFFFVIPEKITTGSHFTQLVLNMQALPVASRDCVKHNTAEGKKNGPCQNATTN